jgi:hypothetical protein
MMANWKNWALVVLLSVGGVRADETRSTATHTWEIARLEGAHAGYFHTVTTPIVRDGQKLLQTTQELRLTVRRYGDIAQLRMDSGTDETAEGKVLGVSMTQYEAGGVLVLKGAVKDGKMHVTITHPGGRLSRQYDWNGKVIGLHAQDLIFQKRKAKEGDKFSFQSYEPSLNTAVTVRVVVGAEEEVMVDGVKKRLLRATLTADKIEARGASIQLPPIIVWLDKDGRAVQRQLELAPLGRILLTRTTQAKATAAVKTALLPDIGLRTFIPLKRRIPAATETSAVVYRVTIDDDKPTTALARDARQQIKGVEGKTFELHVKAVRAPSEEGKETAGKEFLESCYYLNSTNERVKELARKAVGEEKDPWKKAQLIERWVRSHMTLDNGVPFAPAGQVAEKLRGDCRQHALLAAAMCRAAGVPSRTAVGLIYTDHGGRARPVLAFHMWFEVNVKGRWVALDATLGEGSIGADHIKIADHSWHDTHDLLPILPVARVLGKMKIEVMSVEP